MLADRLEAGALHTAETESVIREMAETLKATGSVNQRHSNRGYRSVGGPGMFDVLITIGQRRVVERLRRSPALF